MNWKKIADWYDDFIWSCKRSLFVYRIISIKYFFINAWNYRKELSEIYHVDYYDELLALIHRFNQEFNINNIIDYKYYKSKKLYRKDLIRFYTIKELTERLHTHHHDIRNYGMDGLTDETDKQIRDFNMLFEYIRKYSGRWWL